MAVIRNKIEYLDRIQKYRRKIQTKKIELDLLKEIAQGTPPVVYDRAKVKTAKKPAARFEKIFAQMDETEKKIREYEEKGRMLEEEITDTIEQLEDDEEQLVLKMRYIHGKTFKDIGRKMFCSDRTIRRIHERALENIELYIER